MPEPKTPPPPTDQPAPATNPPISFQGNVKPTPYGRRKRRRRKAYRFPLAVDTYFSTRLGLNTGLLLTMYDEIPLPPRRRRRRHWRTVSE